MTVSHLVGLGHLADDLPSRGVDGGEGFPADGVLPFVVNEQLPGNRKTFFQQQLVAEPPFENPKPFEQD